METSHVTTVLGTTQGPVIKHSDNKSLSILNVVSTAYGRVVMAWSSCDPENTASGVLWDSTSRVGPTAEVEQKLNQFARNFFF